MPIPPFIEEFLAPLAAVLPGEPATLRGSWSTSRRRTYENASPVGSGAGPYVDVIDARWVGAYESTVPLTGIAMLCRLGGAMLQSIRLDRRVGSFAG
jgi:hypothetical protein